MRLLIATVTAGGGHVAAAAALEEAWRALRPSDEVECLDLVKFFSPLHRKLVSDGYVRLVKHAPELWGLMFAKTDNPELARRLNRFKRVLPSNSRVRFARYLKQFNPDAALCTHYLPLEALGRLKAKGGFAVSGAGQAAALAAIAPAQTGKRSEGEIYGGARERPAAVPRTSQGVAPQPFVVSVVTDFEAHAVWMDPCVDLYCVAAEETKARLVARGAAPGNVIATGIPISMKFSTRPDPKAVRKAFGLRDDLPVLLVLSGGFGMGPVAEVVAEMDKLERPFQSVVVTGRNEELRRDLAAVDRKHPTHVLGYASNMHELMAAADLIVTKPGGLTSSEVLAMGKPLFIVNPIPGQEAANSDFLLEGGAAAKVNRVEDLPYRLGQLLGTKRLAEMARAARALGRPDAAQTICHEVVERTSR